MEMVSIQMEITPYLTLIAIIMSRNPSSFSLHVDFTRNLYNLRIFRSSNHILFPRINTNNRLLHRYHCLPWIINDERIHKNCHETKSIWFFRRSSAIVAFHRSISIIDVMRGFSKINFLRNAYWSTRYCNISDKIDVF